MDYTRKIGRKCPGWKAKCGILVENKYGTYCKVCHNNRQKEYYKNHPESTNLSRKNRAKQARKFLNKIKDRVCQDCRRKYPPYVMDFDHIRDKKSYQISPRVGYSIKNLKKEIKKCDIICANCHRIRTFSKKK